jgi:hypothetical protein
MENWMNCQQPVLPAAAAATCPWLKAAAQPALNPEHRASLQCHRAQHQAAAWKQLPLLLQLLPGLLPLQ